MTIPVVEPIAAIDPSLELHVPPEVAHVAVADVPAHNTEGAMTTAGSGNTVAAMVLMHPPGMI